MKRPVRITALSLFFAAGAIISGSAALSLLLSRTFLIQMWRLNPRAQIGLAASGGWGILLLALVCIGCALAAVGLWRTKIWGYRIAIAMLLINLTGDIYNTVSGNEPRAIIGIPIVLLILAFVTPRKIRQHFTT
jgi:uncharacterized membrane protein (DUF2068 family)